MTLACFTVDGPPVPWSRAGGRGGVRFTPPRMRAYQKHIKACWSAMVAGREGWPMDARYAVTIVLVPETKRRSDIDNFGKGLLDALNGLAWDDDSQVDQLSIERCAPLKGGGFMRVSIKAMEPAE